MTTLNEIITRATEEFQEKFYLQEDSPLFLGRDDKMQSFLVSSIRSAIAQAFAAVTLDEREANCSENLAEECTPNCGWNAALGEKQKKEEEFMK